MEKINKIIFNLINRNLKIIINILVGDQCQTIQNGINITQVKIGDLISLKSSLVKTIKILINWENNSPINLGEMVISNRVLIKIKIMGGIKIMGVTKIMDGIKTPKTWIIIGIKDIRITLMDLKIIINNGDRIIATIIKDRTIKMKAGDFSLKF